MTYTMTAGTALTADGATAGCGCCKPPELDVSDEVAELEARRAAVERRLAGLEAEPTP